MSNFPKRGEVFWVCLDPTIGSEIKKTRPGLILSNNTGNKISNRVIIAPITSSTSKIFPFEALLIIKGKESKVVVDQIRAVDKQRLGNKISTVSSREMQQIEKALKLVLSLS